MDYLCGISGDQEEKSWAVAQKSENLFLSYMNKKGLQVYESSGRNMKSVRKERDSKRLDTVSSATI